MTRCNYLDKWFDAKSKEADRKRRSQRSVLLQVVRNDLATIRKRNTTQNAIDNIGKQRDVERVDEIVRQYQGEEMIDADEFEDIREYHRLLRLLWIALREY